MNISYKRAIVTSAIFGTLFLFLVVYLAIVGPSRFLSEKIHFVVNSIVLVLAMIGYGGYLLRSNKNVVIDERDTYLQKKSFGTSMILTLLYVFGLSMVLFIIYRDAETISVTWLWFIAYSTFAFSYFITSSMILLLYGRDH